MNQPIGAPAVPIPTPSDFAMMLASMFGQPSEGGVILAGTQLQAKKLAMRAYVDLLGKDDPLAQLITQYENLRHLETFGYRFEADIDDACMTAIDTTYEVLDAIEKIQRAAAA